MLPRPAAPGGPDADGGALTLGALSGHRPVRLAILGLAETRAPVFGSRNLVGGADQVWAGDARLPAQTRRNPQETSGKSGALPLTNCLQICLFLGPGKLT